MKIFQFGRDETFFVLLCQQADIALQAAKTFHTLVKDYKRFTEYAEKITEIEHNADDLVHELALKVDSSFVTPMDKEDLHSISSALDNVTDAIKAIAQTLMIYQLPRLRPDVEPLALLLVQCMEATKEVVSCLQTMNGREALRPHVLKIDDLENQADETYRQAIAELFHSPARDPFLFIAYKELYDRIEAGINSCEKISDLVEGMVVKYA